MCGIFGFAGNPDKYSPAKIKILGLYNESRGGHATGIWTKETGIRKKAVTTHNFFAGRMLPNKTSMLIGHTRYATVGNRDADANAHPFQYGDVIGAHNGCIYGWHSLASSLGITPNVDSEVIFAAIDMYGHKEGLEMIDGAMAITYVINDTLYLYRNTNPMYIAWDGDTIYWSSLKWSLQAIGFTDVKELKPYKVWRVDNGRLKEIASIKERKAVGYAPKYGVYGSSYSSQQTLIHDWRDDWDYDRENQVWRQKFDTRREEVTTVSKLSNMYCRHMNNKNTCKICAVTDSSSKTETAVVNPLPATYKYEPIYLNGIASHTIAQEDKYTASNISDKVDLLDPIALLFEIYGGLAKGSIYSDRMAIMERIRKSWKDTCDLFDIEHGTPDKAIKDESETIQQA